MFAQPSIYASLSAALPSGSACVFGEFAWAVSGKPARCGRDYVPGIDRQRRTLASRSDRSARLWRGNRLGRKGLRQTTSMDSIGGPEGPVPNFSTSRFTIVLVGSAGAAGHNSLGQRSLREINADLAADGFVAERTGQPYQAAQTSRLLAERA